MQLVSASQISKYRECARKWAWRYIAKLPDPTGPAAALGTEVDDTQLQPYLRDGRTFDYSRESGNIAAAGLAYLPKPKSHGLEVQKHFVMPSPTYVDGQHIGFGYQGFIDLWMPTGGMPDIDGHPVVCDFKTTGNWRYALTPEGLKTNVQAQLYATWAMFSTGARVIDLVWIYFATKGPRKAKRVHLRVHADHVAGQFSAINATALEMYEVRRTCTDPLDLPPNTDACGMFGGCPYQANCNLSPAQIIDSKASQWTQNTESQVSNSSGGAVGLLARLRAAKEPVGGASGYEMSPQQLDGQAAADAGVAAVGINPPEAKLPPAPPVGSVPVPEAVEVAPVKKPVGRPRKAPPSEPFEAAIAKAEGEIDRNARIGALVVELASLLGVTA